MIARLDGILIEKTPAAAIIDCNGVGYRVSISVTTFDVLPENGSRIVLHTSLLVRDDALELVGFATQSERDAFHLLVATPGIGTRTALAILSALSVAELQRAVLSGNTAILQRIPGVGRKTAERLIIELREKVASIDTGAPSIDGRYAQVVSEALSALVVLGYNRQHAEKALRTALEQIQEESSSPTIELLVKRALRLLHTM